MDVAMTDTRASHGLRAAAVTALALATVASVAGCGARSGVSPQRYGEPIDGAVISGCLGDLDCGAPDLCAPSRCIEGACVTSPRITCDDGDACTDDACVPETGRCVSTPRTLDEDGDGHPGPAPGFLPGSPGACGDDCNDTSALSYPGAVEVCDGVDNDCNGIVDDGASYAVSGAPPLLVSVGADQAGLGGLAFGGTTFGVTFSAKGGSWADHFSAFAPTGAMAVPSLAITHENTDAFTGPLVWTGKVFGTAWEDRRDQDFEIYFNRLDANGRKLASDLRITNAPNFSLRPDLVWGGTEFTVVWSDRRDGDANGRIFGQRIDPAGALVGTNVPLTEDGTDADNPHLARGATELGVVFNEIGAIGRQLSFRTVSPDLASLGPSVVLGRGGAASSAIAWSGDRYVVVWDTGAATPGPTIHGAAVAPDGTLLVADRDVTTRAPFARSEALLPLGDRLLLAWAEYEGGSYAVYTKMIGPDLSDLSAPSRVTDGQADSVGPAIAIGPSGTVAVAFEDQRTGAFQVYATELTCVAGAR